VGGANVADYFEDALVDLESSTAQMHTTDVVDLSPGFRGGVARREVGEGAKAGWNMAKQPQPSAALGEDQCVGTTAKWRLQIDAAGESSNVAQVTEMGFATHHRDILRADSILRSGPVNERVSCPATCGAQCESRCAVESHVFDTDEQQKNRSSL
jgi:hypothetical protein